MTNTSPRHKRVRDQTRPPSHRGPESARTLLCMGDLSLYASNFVYVDKASCNVTLTQSHADHMRMQCHPHGTCTRRIHWRLRELVGLLISTLIGISPLSFCLGGFLQTRPDILRISDNLRILPDNLRILHASST